ncbi:MAG: hypothetical protein HZA54_12090 [Planctomycetes bacterium]|nr:hypothetical protein [Planctomycetota bacterium]
MHVRTCLRTSRTGRTSRRRGLRRPRTRTRTRTRMPSAFEYEYEYE